MFAAYVSLRRPHIDAAYQQAARRWETVKDSGWFFYHTKRLLTPWFIWWTAKTREAELAEDHTDLDLTIRD